MSSVFQRGDGRWVVKWKGYDGKAVQRTFKEESDARSFEDELYRDSREGSRLTVFEAVALYVKDHQLCPRLQQQYSWLVCGYNGQRGESEGYAQCIADKYVDELTRRDLNEVRDRAREKKAQPQTINYYVGKLNTAFTYLVGEGLLQRNPWAGIRPLKFTRASRDIRLDDFHAVYAQCPEWLRWACRTALALCLRPGPVELFSLTWDAFDWRHGSVEVHMGKVGRRKTVFPVAEYMDEAKDRFLLDGSDRTKLVCRGRRGQPVAEYGIAWREACRKAGLKPFPFYSLRHLAATEMLAAGADIAAVAANLGHSSPRTTLQVYAHSLPSAQRKASEKAGAIWCGNGEKSSIKSIG